MGRIRQIKPEFWTSLSIAALSLEARLLFIGLWNHADDEGRCVDDPRLIKAAVFPLDDSVSPHEVSVRLHELSDAGRIRRYEVAGKGYVEVVNWAEHQYVQRARPSRIPPPPTCENAAVRELSVSPHGTVRELSVLGQGSGVMGQGSGVRGQSSASPHGNRAESAPAPTPDDDDDQALIETLTELVDRAEQRHRRDGQVIRSRTRWRDTVFDEFSAHYADAVLEHLAAGLTPRQAADRIEGVQDRRPREFYVAQGISAAPDAAERLRAIRTNGEQP